MNKNYSLSIILPVFNETDNIRDVIEHIAVYLQSNAVFINYEIIAVNDGSGDGTAGVLRDLTGEIAGLRTITHGKNLGYGGALITGLHNARYNLVFIMDADGQFKISEMDKFIPYIEDYDMITGYRHRRKDNFCRVMLAKFYSQMVRLFFGVNLKDINCGFKLFKKDALDIDGGVACNSRAGVFYTEILLKAGSRKQPFRIQEIPVEHFPRLKGRQTGASPKVIFDSVVDLLKLRCYMIKTAHG